jgi:flagellar motor component MotA
MPLVLAVRPAVVVVVATATAAVVAVAAKVVKQVQERILQWQRHPKQQFRDMKPFFVLHLQFWPHA